MSYDAVHSDWPDRDRFILSVGHASILHYAFLNVLGYGVELDDFASSDSGTASRRAIPKSGGRRESKSRPVH